MTLRPLLVTALLACMPFALAAPPTSTTDTKESAAQSIDVDALARAKDGKPTEPSPAKAANQPKPVAKPPKAAKQKPKAPETVQQQVKPDAAAQDIDVDALARAKDGKPTEAAPAKAAETDQPKPATKPVKATKSKASVESGKSTAKPEHAAPEPQSVEAKAAQGELGTAAPETSPEPATATPESASQATPAQPASEPNQATSTDATQTPAAQAAPANTAASSQSSGDMTTMRPTPLAPPDAQAQSLQKACTARATALLDAAQKGDYAAATHDFDAQMRTALPPEKFKAAWESLARFGALQARGQSHASESQAYLAITIPLIFDKANLYAQVACGSDGRIAGFYIKPLPASAQ